MPSSRHVRTATPSPDRRNRPPQPPPITVSFPARTLRAQAKARGWRSQPQPPGQVPCPPWLIPTVLRIPLPPPPDRNGVSSGYCSIPVNKELNSSQDRTRSRPGSNPTVWLSPGCQEMGSRQWSGPAAQEALPYVEPRTPKLIDYPSNGTVSSLFSDRSHLASFLAEVAIFLARL